MPGLTPIRGPGRGWCLTVRRGTFGTEPNGSANLEQVRKPVGYGEPPPGAPRGRSRWELTVFTASAKRAAATPALNAG